jgi:DNA-binding NtrC family response regulator
MAKNSDHTIFLVDDDIMSLTLYGQFLKNIGYGNVHLYNSGSDCIEHLSLHPQIIFLDYSMDDMNGIDVLKKVRSFDPSVIVVFISGNENPEVAEDAKRHGAVDFIVKSSINRDRMKNVMEDLEQIVAPKHKLAKKSFFGRMKPGFGL